MMTIDIYTEQYVDTELWNEAEVEAKLEKFSASIDPKIIVSIVEAYVEEYIEEHGIEAGATPEQVEQMNSNTLRLDAIEASYVKSIGGETGEVPVATNEDIELILNGGYSNAG